MLARTGPAPARGWLRSWAVDIELRAAAPGDVEAIRSIYNPEVIGSTATFDLVPRTAAAQAAWLRAHAGAHPAIVAVDVDQVIGFGSLSPWRDRPAYSTSAEDSVYVHPDQRGRGVGRLLLDELVRLGRLHGFHALFARIVGDHQASIVLHQRCGFEVVGVEKQVGRKFGQWLDVVVMERLL